jgi:hypothetical protein
MKETRNPYLIPNPRETTHEGEKKDKWNQVSQRAHPDSAILKSMVFGLRRGR